MAERLPLLRPRGGEIGPHADGWGVAFYEGRAARIFKEPIPASQSRCLAFIVIGHIRKANPSHIGRTSANTHPFVRELGGRAWVFAHNGKLPGIKSDTRFALHRFRPMGETDSEHAFCFLLNRIERSVRTTPFQPAQLASELAVPVAMLSELGELNFLLSDGLHLVAFSNLKLQALHRRCQEQGCDQSVMLLATTPLTDESWSSLDMRRLYVFAGGEDVATLTPPKLSC